MTRTTSLLLCTLLVASATARDATHLLLDGQLRTTTGGLDESRLVVYRDGRPLMTLDQGLHHFQLELELGYDYLLRFTARDRIAKSLHIDAHVPHAQAPHRRPQFDFLVTLEPQRPGEVAYYFGPVGFIRFDARVGCFDYDPTYRAALIVKPEMPGRRMVDPFPDPTLELGQWVEERLDLTAIRDPD